jgi:hypothetical protein
MLIDGLVVWGLTILEKRLKEQKAAKLEAERVHNESGKKESRALKAANVQQRKAEQKKQHIDQKSSHSAPRSPIQQPDKSKKTH